MRKGIVATPLLAFASLVLACTEAPLTKSVGESKEEKQVDPVALLKKVFTAGKSRAASTVWTVGEAECDVRKTDSLVSPYSGFITFHAHYTSKSSETIVRKVIRLEYAFQDKRWVQKKAEFRPADNPDAAWWDMYHEFSGTYARNLAECFSP